MVFIIEWILFLIGASFLARHLVDFWCFLLAVKFSKKDYCGKEAWALVTASTDGIGLGFVQELAKKGFNIVQVSRNLEKMKTVSAEIQGKYQVKTKEIVFDFDKISSDFSKSYKNLQELLKEGPDRLYIEFVVNNVGVALAGFENNLDKIVELLSINVWSVVLISKLMVTEFSADKQKVKIINLSSTGAIPGLALSFLSVYAATKAFSMVFTEVLIGEGVQGLALTPGWVDTPLTRPMGDVRTFLISKEECAEKALEQFGSVSVTYGHYKHWLAAWHYRLSNIRVAWIRLC